MRIFLFYFREIVHYKDKINLLELNVKEKMMEIDYVNKKASLI